MRSRWLFGLIAVGLLAAPVAVRAQRGGGGGGARSAAPSGGMSFHGGGTYSAGIRTIPSVSVANGSSTAQSRTNPFSAYGMPAPYRLAGAARSPAREAGAPHAGTIPTGHGGDRGHHPRHPRGGAPQFYFLTGGGYYYAGPGLFDDSDNQTQDETDQRDVAVQQDEGQQADNQQPPDNEQNYAGGEMSAAAPAPPPQESAPLPDVGSFTLVMRDGTKVDALAFTRAQDKIIYITPDGGRRTVAVSDIDTGSTQRVNEERGTPLQMPL